MMKASNIAKLSIMLIPCHKLSMIKGGYELDKECIADEEEQKNYL